MAPDEYTKALDTALEDLEKKVFQRDMLTAQIAGLKETVRVLSSRTQLTTERQTKVAQLIALVDSATPNLTDAVRSLLTRVYPKELTAIEVRNSLENTPSFEDANISLSACHAALKRLVTDELAEPGTPQDGKTSYRAKLKPVPRNNLYDAIYGIGTGDPSAPATNSWVGMFTGPVDTEKVNSWANIFSGYEPATPPSESSDPIGDAMKRAVGRNHPLDRLRAKNRQK